VIVWISGPTGAGKSSLAKVFRRCGFAVVEETLPKRLFSSFASDPIRYCSQLQEEIMRSRYDMWRGLSGASQVVFDRSIDEDAQVFCRLHLELGFLNEQEFGQLQAFAKDLQAKMPGPDLILFMSPERRVLTERITEETHPDLILRSLERQLSLYAEWLDTRPEEALRLDNSRCGVKTIQQLFSENSRC
jgi:deoxyadenosine/deoxycytidine kinase